MDDRVKEVQLWLGVTFPSYFYYDENGNHSGSFPVNPDGKTGNTTVTALIMALQIYKNLTPVDGIWGTATTNACPTISRNTTDAILIRIVQGGFYCKGYNPGAFDGIFGNGTANVAIKFKDDLGIGGDEVLPSLIVKSLLTTDPTIETGTTNPYIRKAQQYLNANYASLYLSALGYIPTSGHFERKTSKALIYALQKEVGTTTDGALGPATFSLMPVLSQGSNDAKKIKVLQCALDCNGFAVAEINGIYDQHVENRVTQFQNFMCLQNDPSVIVGSVNRRTWGALLWSKGDTDRKANAGDTRFQLTAVQAQSLYNDGIRYIGRYLTKVEGGLDKNLTEQEVSNIHGAGLKIFPLFQENNAQPTDFTYRTGYDSWVKAVLAATKLRLPGCVIYFTVDFDATDAQAKSIVKEFFQGINDAQAVNPSIYQIGIYSARNTCSVICSYGLAVKSFVSDMSTGYSGNLGYLLPVNWSFDQYYTVSYTASDGSKIDLDKVMASGLDDGVGSFDAVGDCHWDLRNIDPNVIPDAVARAVVMHNVIPLISQLEDAYWERFPNETATNCILSVLYYLWHKKYEDWDFTVTVHTNTAFRDYVSNNCTVLAATLDPYIRKDGYAILKDSSNRLIELHHLAAVTSAYLDPPSPFKSEWYGWAGDLASAFHEIDVLRENLGTKYVGNIEHARDRIGRMEVVGDDVQMNYCDIFGDADGFGLYTVIETTLSKNISKEHILSGAFYQYYSIHYTKRMLYLLNNLPLEMYNINSITSRLYDYFLDVGQTVLRGLKAEMTLPDDNQKAIIEACCRAFAEFIMHEFNSY